MPNRHSFYIATSNVLNFANPNRVYYPNAQPYSTNEYQQKLHSLSQLLAPTKSDILALQEVWDEQAVQDLAKNLGFNSSSKNGDIYAPLISNDPNNAITQGNGATNTPSLAIISHYPRIDGKYLTEINQDAIIDIPDMGAYTKYDRPPLMVTLDVNGQPLLVVNAHLKSKRPLYLRDDNGEPLEDIDDPNIRVRAKLRSLCIRASQAASLRISIMQKLAKTKVPMVLLGDMNDVTMSVTTQLLAETGEANFDKAERDVALFDAAQIQLKYSPMHNMAYSHIHQGAPEVIDQLFVSEEFLTNSKHAIGYVERVDYFNDHLKWDYHDRPTDHGVVRAKLTLK